jgi:hypothetical protein
MFRTPVIVIFFTALFAPGGQAQEMPQPVAPVYEITGAVHSGKTPLPGVTVTVANTLTGKKFATVSRPDGKFSFSGILRGRYVVRIEFMGFAVFTQEVVLNPENNTANIDAELLLASRQQQENQARLAATTATRRGFQSVTGDPGLTALGGADSGTGSIETNNSNQNGSDLSGLPFNGGGADSPTESVSISGARGRTQDFGNGNEEEIQGRIEEFRERMQANEGGGFGGAPGGGGFGGRPGGGGINIGRIGGRGFNINQPHGALYFSDDTSALDATPFSITGTPTVKSDYNQAHFGANVGGPLNIPKIFNGGTKWFFFAGWNGSRGDSPYDSFSTVPTLAERDGNFSGATYSDGTPVQIFNPTTGQLYQFNAVSNAIDPTLISSAATELLQYIPLPNITTNSFGQNFHYVTSADSNSDAVTFRLIHNLGSSTLQAPGGNGGRGGGGRGQRSQNNINFGLNWSRNSTSLVNAFPSLAGSSGTQGLNATAGWTYSKNRFTNIFRFGYNHNRVSTTNLYSNITDVAGEAGITGISDDPFHWGLPVISFTSFGGLNNPIPRRELDQTYTISDTISWNHKKHNFRFGGDYRRILQSFHSARNAEGSFVFTGYATSNYTAGSTEALPDTGYDFADFLLGYPQQTSLQFGTDSYDFRSNSFDFFAQDDWRILANLSLNLGVRYEYNGPYTEAQNRISNLLVGPGFTTATPVIPAGAVLPTGTGTFLVSNNPSLIQPDRNDFAPRLGLAWKPLKKTVTRAGYGINYNLVQYGAIIQNFAFQPPFAETSTNTTSVTGLTGGTPLTLVDGFPAASSGTVTNNFGVDTNYRLPYVQIWNLDIQRELPGSVVLNIGYNGAKGTRLDTERALVVTGGQPFIYESSEGNSVLHAASARVRKRMSKGFGVGAQYVFSKSLDDASSVGGGGVVVAQDAFDISADRGLSSFNQTHRFTGNWTYDLPFGENRAFAQKGALSHILGQWQWSGSFTVASGLYFSPRVLGGALDIDRGVSGSLRANVVPAQSITVSNPSAQEWFNTAAFCTPGLDCVNPGGTSFGDAGRNIIEGPGSVTFNMTLNRTITIKDARTLDLRISGNNIFNHVNFAGINTTVNSLTFGEVISTGGMRRITVQARFRF